MTSAADSAGSVWKILVPITVWEKLVPPQIARNEAVIEPTKSLDFHTQFGVYMKLFSSCSAYNLFIISVITLDHFAKEFVIFSYSFLHH